MTIELTVVISVGCALLGALIGIAGEKRRVRNDASTQGEKDGVMLTEIGYVKAGIDDIKRKQEQQDTKHLDLVSRMVAVEASTKQAHHRIDRTEGKV